MYLRLEFNVEKAVLKYCSGEISKLMPFTSELRRSWNRKGEEMQELVILREDGTELAPSIPFGK